MDEMTLSWIGEASLLEELVYIPGRQEMQNAFTIRS